MDGYQDQSEEDEWAEQGMLIKADPGFKQRYGCMVAPAIVDVAGQTKTRVKVFNPYTEPVTIHGDVVMASIEDTSVKRVLMNEESQLDQYNYQSTRQVVLEEELPVSGTKGRVGWMGSAEEVPVPPHLQSMFEKATAKSSKAKQKAINQLLNSFQDVYSKD